ncbi:hypothetical protein ApDm4_0003 [Acetobacter pomorum]|nr:hypothetical protein ApDm4_0003 [Acetobacter pomorum]
MGQQYRVFAPPLPATWMFGYREKESGTVGGWAFCVGGMAYQGGVHGSGKGHQAGKKKVTRHNPAGGFCAS